MKNITKIGMSLLFAWLFLFMSASASLADAAIPTNPGATEQTKFRENGDRILIACFTRVGNTDFDDQADVISSASMNLVNGELRGNTELIAGMIHEALGGDLFLIKTAHRYPAEYNELLDFAAEEQARDFRPDLDTIENMDDYDVVFLGFPNWWYDMPMAVYSFLEAYDFSSKTVIPFNTSGGSGFSISMQTIREMLPDSIVPDGITVYENQAKESKERVLTWLQGLY